MTRSPTFMSLSVLFGVGRRTPGLQDHLILSSDKFINYSFGGLSLFTKHITISTHYVVSEGPSMKSDPSDPSTVNPTLDLLFSFVSVLYSPYS